MTLCRELRFDEISLLSLLLDTLNSFENSDSERSLADGDCFGDAFESSRFMYQSSSDMPDPATEF